LNKIKVNGEETVGGHRYTELDAPSPQDPYGVSKWEAEQVLHRVAQETGLEVVIVRPPLVSGAGIKGNFTQVLKVLAKGIPSGKRLGYKTHNQVSFKIYIELQT